eukprot:gene26298-17390_t
MAISQESLSAEQMLLAVLSGLIDQADLVCGTEGDGPFSAEQMLLAVLSGLIDQADLVCGTEGDGPFSAEQMLLAVLSGLIDQADLVCGTESDVLSPLIPPEQLFIPLHRLLREESVGNPTTLATRADLIAMIHATGSTRMMTVPSNPLGSNRPIPGTNMGGGFIMPTPYPTMAPSTSDPAPFTLPRPQFVAATSANPSSFILPTPIPPSMNRGVVAQHPAAPQHATQPVGNAAGASSGAAAYMQLMGNLMPGH